MRQDVSGRVLGLLVSLDGISFAEESTLEAGRFQHEGLNVLDNDNLKALISHLSQTSQGQGPIA